MSTATMNDLASRLIEENDEFRTLHEEHFRMERDVNELVRKKTLTPEEEMELTRLKKLKLLGKDRMEKILSEARKVLRGVTG
ncbi:MAG: DUF465 domain-containing protein [Nitrospinae bacterium]|nr:DUF465 domain-containing protein [Nitrospinota bacterium]